MKTKNIFLTLAIIAAMTSFTGCDTSSDSSSKKSSPKSAVSTTKKAVSKTKRTMTEAQAIKAAKTAIESELAKGNVLGGNKSATAYKTVLFGDVTCKYNSASGCYNVSCKGTCWGKDSYGRTKDKYKFSKDVLVYDSGRTYVGSIYLSKA